jgi:starch phosphorylase
VNHNKAAVELAAWKAKVNRAWPAVSIRRIDHSVQSLVAGEKLKIQVAAKLGELGPDDVVLECLIGTETEHEAFTVRERVKLNPSGSNAEEESLFELDLSPPLSGLQFYKLRIYPNHRLLSHPFETGRMIWL